MNTIANKINAQIAKAQAQIETNRNLQKSTIEGLDFDTLYKEGFPEEYVRLARASADLDRLICTAQAYLLAMENLKDNGIEL